MRCAKVEQMLPEYIALFRIAYIPKDGGRDMSELEAVHNKIILRGI